MDVVSVRRAFAGAVLVVLLMTGAACQSRRGAGDAGTTTGLPYRPPGSPTYVEVSPSFPVFPSPRPASN
jgi:hypothetical protein